MFAHVTCSPKTGPQAHFEPLVTPPGRTLETLWHFVSSQALWEGSGAPAVSPRAVRAPGRDGGVRSTEPGPPLGSKAQLCGWAGATLGELPAFPAQASGRLFLHGAGLGWPPRAIAPGRPPRAIAPGTHPGPPAETGLPRSFCTGPRKPSSGPELGGDNSGLRVFSVVPKPVCSTGVKAAETGGGERARPGPSKPSAARPVREPQFASLKLAPQSPPEERWGGYRPAHGAVLRPGHRSK